MSKKSTVVVRDAEDSRDEKTKRYPKPYDPLARHPAQTVRTVSLQPNANVYGDSDEEEVVHTKYHPLASGRVRRAAAKARCSTERSLDRNIAATHAADYTAEDTTFTFTRASKVDTETAAMRAFSTRCANGTPATKPEDAPTPSPTPIPPRALCTEKDGDDETPVDVVPAPPALNSRMYRAARHGRSWEGKRRGPIGLIPQKPVKVRLNRVETPLADSVACANVTVQVLTAVGKMRRAGRRAQEKVPARKHFHFIPKVRPPGDASMRVLLDYSVPTDPPLGSSGWLANLKRVCLKLCPKVAHSVCTVQPPHTVNFLLGAGQKGVGLLRPTLFDYIAKCAFLSPHCAENFGYFLPFPDPKLPFDNHYSLSLVNKQEMTPGALSFLVSSQGVTLREGGVTNSDFTPLLEYCREYQMYKLVVTLPFFRLYRVLRVFKAWKRFMKFQQKEQSRELLLEKHLAFNPVWSASLLSVKRLCEEISALCFVTILRDTATLHTFAAKQADQIKLCKRHILDKISLIRDIVSQACTEAQQKLHASDFAGLRGTSQDTLMVHNFVDTVALRFQRISLQKTTRAFILLSDYLLKAALVDLCLSTFRSLEVLLQTPEEDRDSDAILSLMVASGWTTKSELHQATRECAKDTASILSGEKKGKGSGIPVECNAVELAVHFARQTRQTSRRGPSTSKAAAGATSYAMRLASGGKLKRTAYIPVFTAEAVIEEDTGRLNVASKEADFLESTRHIIAEVERVIADVPSLAEMEIFQQHTTIDEEEEGEDEETPTRTPVSSFLAASNAYQKTREGITVNVKKNFAALMRKVASFQKFVDIYVFHQKLDLVKIREEEGCNVTTFMNLLKVFKEQSTALENMPTSAQVSIFTVSLQNAKEICLPAPKCGRTNVTEIIPVIARDMNAHLLSTVQKYVQQLGSPITELDDLVCFIENLAHINETYDAVLTLHSKVQDFVKLIEDEKIECPPDDIASWGVCTNPEMEKLKILLREADLKKDLKIQDFAAVIEDMFTELAVVFQHIQDSAVDALKITSESEAEKSEELKKLLLDCTNARKREHKLLYYVEMFHLERTNPSLSNTVFKDVTEKHKLWNALTTWLALREEWKATPFRALDTDLMQERIAQYSKIVNVATRLFAFNHVVLKLRVLVDECTICVPLIVHLKNPALTKTHYAKLGKLVASDKLGHSDATLEDILESRVLQHKDAIATLSLAATQEAELDESHHCIERRWACIEFSFVVYRVATRECELIHNVDPLLAMVSDTYISLCAISSSKFCSEALNAKAEKWVNMMQNVEAKVALWLTCQKSWTCLEEVFTCADLSRMFAKETRLFALVDKEFRDRLKRISENPYVVTSVNSTDIFHGLEGLVRQLEKVLASLAKALGEKRRCFPRYFFLTDPDLMDFISHAKSPSDTTKHLPKIFENVSFLTVTDSSIDAVTSTEGEVLKLSKAVRCKKDGDKWVDKLEESMWTTLRKGARSCLFEYESKPLNLWITASHHPSQLLIAVHSVAFCKEIEDSFGKSNRLRDFAEETVEKLSFFSKLAREVSSKPQKKFMAAILTVTVHFRDIVARLLEANITSPTAFEWKCCLRTYWSEAGSELILSHIHMHYPYGYEFTGAASKLVSTSVTERAALTISSAMSSFMGTAPTGPAGTGKTEIVRDFAKTTARFCIVYNCSEGLQYRTTENFFSGLCQAGAWVCLDEFNRISCEVLSAVSQQLYDARNALQSGSGMLSQGGKSIIIKSTFAAFATMNNIKMGRNELPENVKSYFRPITIIHTDSLTVIRVLLYVLDFRYTEVIARKVHTLFEQCGEVLSCLRHYDFGMRCMKTSLLQAGEVHAKETRRGTGESFLSASAEEVIVASAIAESILPRLVEADCVAFKHLLAEVFPDVVDETGAFNKVAPSEVPTLAAKTQCLHDSFKSLIKNLEEGGYHSSVAEKTMQFSQALSSRHGVMVLGETGSGKTLIRTALKSVIGARDKVINPRAVTHAALHGCRDPVTNQWCDGLVSSMMSCPDYIDSWLVFDGEITSLWIESLNSALDESRLLCLPSGHRVKLPEKLKFIFETDSIENVSPATVTRCAILWLTASPPQHIINVFLRKHVKKKGLDVFQQLMHLFETHFDKLHAFAQQFATGLPGFALMHSALKVARALLVHGGVQLAVERSSKSEEYIPTVHPKPQKPFSVRQYNEQVANLIFTYACIAGLGACFPRRSRERLADVVLESCGSLVAYHAETHILDQIPDFTSLSFKPIASVVPPFTPQSPFQGLTVYNALYPTIEMERVLFVGNLLIKDANHLNVVGGSGCGKSSLVSELLCIVGADGEDPEMERNERSVHDGDAVVGTPRSSTASVVPFAFHSVTFVLSSHTAVSRICSLFESISFANDPSGPTLLAVVLEDVNLPERTLSEPCVHEFLRHTMEHLSFYASKTEGGGDWVGMAPFSVVATSAAEKPLQHFPRRCLKNFFSVLTEFPPEEELALMTESLMLSFFRGKGFPAEITGVSSGLASAVAESIILCREAFAPTPSKPHLNISLHQWKSTVQGITLTVPFVCRNPKSLVALTVHELSRSIEDRLSGDAERGRYQSIVTGCVNRALPAAAAQGVQFEKDGWPLMFSNVLRPDSSREDSVYELIKDAGTLPELFDFYAKDIGLDTPLVFFNECCVQLAKILRALQITGRHLMLFGVPGSGKKTLTRLASMMLEFQCFSVESSRHYTLESFRKDLIQVHDIAGLKREEVVFFLNDAVLAIDGVPEEILFLINHKSVPGLMSNEDRASRVTMLSAEEKDPLANVPPQHIWEQYCADVCAHLHVCLSSTPCSRLLKLLCRFPSFSSSASLIWFDTWSQAALTLIAETRLTETNKPSKPRRKDSFLDGFDSFDDEEEEEEEEPEESDRAGRYISTAVACGFEAYPDFAAKVAAMHSVAVEASVRHFAKTKQLIPISPAHFFDLLSLYEGIYSARMTECNTGEARITGGINVIEDTQATVLRLNKTLFTARELQENAKEKVETLLCSLEEKQDLLRHTTAVVQEKGAQALEGKTNARSIQHSAQQEYDAVVPDMRNAAKAVDSLSKQDILELRSYASASKAIAHTSEAVLILLDEKKADDWVTAKGVFARGDFLERLQNYDKDSVTAEMIVRLHRLINDTDFTPERVGQSGSYACRSICLWVRAIYRYFHMEERVIPKRAQLAEAEAAYLVAKEAHDVATAEQDALQAEFDELSSQKKEAEEAEMCLQDRISKAGKQVVNAKEILSVIRPQLDKWKAEVNQIKKQVALCTAFSLLSAAIVSYHGPFPSSIKRFLLTQWAALLDVKVFPEFDVQLSKDVPLTFEFDAAVGDRDKLTDWALQGLADDTMTIQNAIILNQALSVHAKRWPLIVDPQGTSMAWFLQKCRQEKRPLKVLNHPQGGTASEYDEMTEVVEAAMVSGTLIFIREVNTIDPHLNRLLVKSMKVTPAGTKLVFQAESGEINVHDEFKLILVSSSEQMKLSAALWAKVNVISFVIGREAATSQILSDLIATIHPELEEARVRNLKALVANRASLAVSEDKMLEELRVDERQLLGNETLVGTLAQLRSTWSQVDAQLCSVRNQTADIAASRRHYSGVARIICDLFFLSRAFVVLSPLYNCSFSSLRHVAMNAVAEYTSLPSDAPPPETAFKRSKSKLFVTAETTKRSYRNLNVNAALSNTNTLSANANTLGVGGYTQKASTTPQSVNLSPHNASGTAATLDVEELEDFLRQAVFSYISRGIQRRHKRGFALLLAAEELLSTSDDVAPDWALLTEMHQNTTPPPAAHTKKSPSTTLPFMFVVSTPPEDADTACPNGFPDAAWRALKHIEANESTGCLRRISSIVAAHCTHFFEWAALGGAGTLPPDVPLKLTPLQTLLLVNALQPDALFVGAEVFIRAVLGEHFTSLQGGVSWLPSALSCGHPVLLVLHAGSDPIPNIMKAGSKPGAKVKVRQLSCGQGQEDTIEAAVEACRASGEWVVVHNAHLGSADLLRCVTQGLPMIPSDTQNTETAESLRIMKFTTMATVTRAAGLLKRKTLVAKSYNMGGTTTQVQMHQNFKVFLTVSSGSTICDDVVQRCAKVDCGAEEVAATITRLFTTIRTSLFDTDSREHRGVVACLCAFHAVLLGRLHRNHSVWASVCKFEDSDLSASFHFIERLLEDTDVAREPGTFLPQDWAAVRSMVSDLHYSCRLDHETDCQIVDALLTRMLTPEVAMGKAPVFANTCLPDAQLPYMAYLDALSVLEVGGSPEFLGLGQNNDICEQQCDSRVVMQVLSAVEPSTSQEAGGADECARQDPQESMTVMNEVNSARVAAVAASVLRDSFAPFADGVRRRSQTATAQADPASQYPPLSLLSLASINERASGFNTVSTLSVKKGGLMRSCLQYELDSYNALLTTVHTSLMDLLSVLDGKTTTDAGKEAVFRSLLSGSVPERWLERSFPSERPLGAWVRDLAARVRFYQAWMAAGTTEFWLAAFYRPSRLFVTMQRVHANAKKSSIDDFVVMGEFGTPPIAEKTSPVLISRASPPASPRSPRGSLHSPSSPQKGKRFASLRPSPFGGRRLSTFVTHELPQMRGAEESLDLSLTKHFSPKLKPVDDNAESMFEFGSLRFGTEEVPVLTMLYGDGCEWSADTNDLVPTFTPGKALIAMPPIRLHSVLRDLVPQYDAAMKFPIFSLPSRVLLRGNTHVPTYSFSLPLPVKGDSERALAECGAALVGQDYG